MIYPSPLVTAPSQQDRIGVPLGCPEGYGCEDAEMNGISVPHQSPVFVFYSMNSAEL